MGWACARVLKPKIPSTPANKTAAAPTRREQATLSMMDSLPVLIPKDAPPPYPRPAILPLQAVFLPPPFHERLGGRVHLDERGPVADGQAVVAVALELGGRVEGDAPAADAERAVALRAGVGEPVEEGAV